LEYNLLYRININVVLTNLPSSLEQLRALVGQLLPIIRSLEGSFFDAITEGRVRELTEVERDILERRHYYSWRAHVQTLRIIESFIRLFDRSYVSPYERQEFEERR